MAQFVELDKLKLKRRFSNGLQFERRLAKKYRDKGAIVIRSAGSQGAFDLIIIDPVEKVIELVQCKTGDSFDRLKQKLHNEWAHLDGEYKVRYVIKGNNGKTYP